MTTLTFDKECVNPWNSAMTPNNAENLEDRFWAALNFAIDDGGPSGNQAGFLSSPIEPKSPVIFVNSRRPPPQHKDDFSAHYSIAPPRRDVQASQRRTEPRQMGPQRKNSGSLRLKVPPSTPFVSITVTPTTTGPRSPVPASATQNQWHLPTPSGMAPSTPALELVSNFLDSIVRLSDSRSSTPQASVSVGEDGDTLIVELKS